MPVINVGSAANDGTGDTIRAGAQNINAGFAAITSGVIAPLTVENAMLATGAVDARVIAANAVTSSELSSTAISDKLGYVPAALDGTSRLTASQFPVSLALTNGASFVADADLDYTLAGVSGFFTDYDCKAAFSMRFEQSEDLTSTGESGAFRDGLVIQHIDKDNTAYSGASRLAVSHAARILMNGSFSSQEKDLVALSVASIGRIEWGPRGLSGVTCDVIQYGQGVGSNEFIVQQPVAANTLSLSLAAVQGVVRQWKAASDGTHIHRCFLAQNDQGYAITSAISLVSTVSGGARDGSFNSGLDFSLSTVNNSALKLTGAGAGATVIEVDTNDYQSFDRTNNIFNWVIGGTVAGSIRTAGYTSAGYVKPASYTVAGLPSAATSGAGAIVYVSNESGGAVPAFSDGTNWRRVTDRIVVS